MQLPTASRTILRYFGVLNKPFSIDLKPKDAYRIFCTARPAYYCPNVKAFIDFIGNRCELFSHFSAKALETQCERAPSLREHFQGKKTQPHITPSNQIPNISRSKIAHGMGTNSSTLPIKGGKKNKDITQWQTKSLSHSEPPTPPIRGCNYHSIDDSRTDGEAKQHCVEGGELPNICRLPTGNRQPGTNLLICYVNFSSSNSMQCYCASRSTHQVAA